MRFVDLALMAMPLVLLVAWFMGARRLGVRGLAAMAMLLCATGAVLFWLGRNRSVTGHYAPARLRDGRVVQGRGD